MVRRKTRPGERSDQRRPVSVSDVGELTPAELLTGTAVGGLLLPLLLPTLLNKYGSPSTLRGLAVVQIILLCCSLPFIKGRLPEARVHGPAARSRPTTWMRNRTILFLLFANTLQGLAYFVPVLWLPSEYCSLIPRLGDDRHFHICSLCVFAPFESHFILALSCSPQWSLGGWTTQHGHALRPR